MHHGQEIYLFFFRFGNKGIIGAIISSLVIGGIIFLTFRLIRQKNITDYYEFLETINRTRTNVKFNKIISYIVNIFLLISFYIMIAGFSAYIFQELKISPIIGSTVIALLSYLTFGKNLEGIIKVNTFLIPILIAFIIMLGVISARGRTEVENMNIYEEGNWIISGVLYGSYNSIILIPILITLKKYIKNTYQTIMISSTTVFIIILLVISIYEILSKINIDISGIELPITYAVSFMGIGYKIIYSFIITSSIFTTAISSGYAFLNNISKTKKMYKYLNFFICISGILISGIGFSNLINYLYPCFGVLGLIQIILITKSNFKLSIEKNK